MASFPVIILPKRHGPESESMDPEIKAALLGLIMVSFDWLSDIGTGLYHAAKGNIEESLLTFGIVFASGLLITLFYLIDRGYVDY